MTVSTPIGVPPLVVKAKSPACTYDSRLYHRIQAVPKTEGVKLLFREYYVSIQELSDSRYWHNSAINNIAVCAYERTPHV